MLPKYIAGNVQWELLAFPKRSVHVDLTGINTYTQKMNMHTLTCAHLHIYGILQESQHLRVYKCVFVCGCACVFVRISIYVLSI